MALSGGVYMAWVLLNIQRYNQRNSLPPNENPQFQGTLLLMPKNVGLSQWDYLKIREKSHGRSGGLQENLLPYEGPDINI